MTGYQTYAFFNNDAASWGIVVIASDNSNVGSGQYHKAAIDYMMKQNAGSADMAESACTSAYQSAGPTAAGPGRRALCHSTIKR